MKYCTKCGNQIVDEAVICPNCGCAVTDSPAAGTTTASSSGLTTAAKVFMVLGTVFMAIYILPLAWCLPMTITYFNKVKRGEPIGIGFKICSLLFVSVIAGILMLCDKNN